MTLLDLVEIVGSLLILAAFAAAQKGLLDLRSRAYLGLNVVGSAALAIVALLHQSWGFLMLEATWAVVSAISLTAVLRRAQQRARAR
jgi:hypothetical protein